MSRTRGPGHDADAIEVEPLRSLRLDWDRSYGIDRRRGWTAHVNGRVVAQFRTLPAALWAMAKAILDP